MFQILKFMFQGLQQHFSLQRYKKVLNGRKFCYNLTKIVFLSTTPPTLGTDVFRKLTLSSISVYVPAGSVSAYTSLGGIWLEFNIQASSSTNIDKIVKEGNNASVYNMNGQRVEKVRFGIYIKNNKKILVK